MVFCTPNSSICKTCTKLSFCFSYTGGNNIVNWYDSTSTNIYFLNSCSDTNIHYTCDKRRIRRARESAYQRYRNQRRRLEAELAKIDLLGPREKDWSPAPYNMCRNSQQETLSHFHILQKRGQKLDKAVCKMKSRSKRRIRITRTLRK
jgi:hypothetical protein